DAAPEDGAGEAAMAGCAAAARAGFEVLARGGAALEAAVAAVVALEDDPRFNAGLGSALTIDGEVECDASVMAGDGRAGAVGAVREVKNPVLLARLVMERTPHVLLVGAGAAALAAEAGWPPLPAGALVTPEMRDRWQAALTRRNAVTGGGTVGCVARDAAGRVAAATSTGGTMLKRRGRVGDSAVIGAGTYADDGAGAVSCTGLGEAFIRAVAAKQAVEAMRAGRAPAEAAREVLPAVRRHGGSGGLICVDGGGRLGLAFDTARMAHAWIDAGGQAGQGFHR
ncbi:MAG TPA: isoaspartyl peptidase/L-asparaginase, partial [Polyangia bacterium]|nr:isoaspartyl peptidase/L-asparaginase [Polyangia bacterium]